MCFNQEIKNDDIDDWGGDFVPELNDKIFTLKK